jgi:hypothetical protein
VSITALLLPRIELCRAVAKSRPVFWWIVVNHGIFGPGFRV